MVAQAIQAAEQTQHQYFRRPVEAIQTRQTAKTPCGQTTRLFGLDIRDATLDEAATWTVRRAKASLMTDIAFVNAHSINVLNRNAGFAADLSAFDCIFADGIGLRLAARSAGVTLRDNVNGTDLFPLLCKAAVEDRVEVYFLGAAPGVAEAAARNMNRAYPDLLVAGTAAGYFADASAEEKAIEAINASGAKILLVGMGVPSQERWIARNRHRLSPSVVIGVGGLFDYYSGNIARAPLWMRRRGLEWAWRLALEPKRLANRYLFGNAEFLIRLAALRLLSPQLFDQAATAAATPPFSAVR